MAKPAYSLEFEKPLRELEKHLEQLHQQSLENHLDLSGEIAALEKKLEAAKQETYAGLTPWQRVQIARHPKRPYSLDYIQALFEGFQELHGDRLFHDDQALIGGPAFFEGQAVMLLAQQKGRETKEKISRNFGMPHPEGYRKALRLMKMADEVRPARHLVHRHPGRLPRHRRRGAPCGRGHRRQPARDGDAGSARPSRSSSARAAPAARSASA